MSGIDWEDPFREDDPEARERARRRAERDARRRARRESLAGKVADHDAQARAAAADGARDGDSDRGSVSAGAGLSASTRARAEQALERLRGGAPDPATIRRRRIFALLAAAGVVVIGAFALAEIADRIGGSEPAPAPPEPQLRVENLTIPEGLDRRQIAALAEEAGLRGDYARAARDHRGFNPGRYGAEDAPSLEGFLFPATYELERRAHVRELVARQLAAFEDNIARVDLSYAKSKNLTVYDVLKIASMIEREIQVPRERRLAAAVIYNRLAAGDTLGIDATIRYEDQNYDEQLTRSRLEEDTPYNTRTNAGLPPTPIGNPGLASIRAAANPARSDVYYFVVEPGTCGEHVFVETEAEFIAAEAAYQKALAEQGGSPTDC